MMTDDQCADAEDAARALIRTTAETRCTHETEWVVKTSYGTARACWGCLLDAYFRPV